MPCLRVVDRRALVTLLLCAGAARALTAVPTTLGPAVSSTEITKKVSRPAGLGLTAAERVAYQRAIEEVRWRHRIWPNDNPQPKPSLDALLSQAQLKKKVADYLRTSQALADYWQRPISAEELQAEMERMARDTKQPNVLRELFEALGNDPAVIAECLARSILAERLAADLSARDKTVWLSSAVAKALDTPSVTTAVQNFAYSLPKISTADPPCADDTWTATTIVNAPHARDGHTVVWTGSEMIIWGGTYIDGSGWHNLNTGGRYDPATDTWTATSTTDAPVARWHHSGVWTGAEMIVWGGYGGNNEFLATGGRYNPATDSWTATSTANTPEARGWHTAIWTASEMIVWGGYNYTNLRLNSGARYDPVTDNWIATSTTNAPEARWLHTVEWTGNEMIIWGGTNETIYLNTGGRYNPSADSWTPTGVPNDVLGRAGHTAVWTGGEMIVWGGADSTFNDCNTGGRYNPGTDSWIASSAANAPSPRESHSAVWTGGEMIVWGGIFCFPCVNFNNGGRYNAGTDSWVPTSTTNAPQARDLHTAIWTGSEMIVWGGGYFVGNNFIFLNTGGRYCAQSGPTPTPTPTATASPTSTAAPTATPPATATPTASLTPTATATATPSATATPTVTPTSTPRPTPTPRIIPTPRTRPTPPARP